MIKGGFIVNKEEKYAHSDKIVSREIEGEIIIIPLASGIGNMEDELFTFNETGKEVWKRLDGKKSLAIIIDELTSKFDSPKKEIEKDVLGLTKELIKSQMIAVASAA